MVQEYLVQKSQILEQTLVQHADIVVWKYQSGQGTSFSECIFVDFADVIVRKVDHSQHWCINEQWCAQLCDIIVRHDQKNQILCSFKVSLDALNVRWRNVELTNIDEVSKNAVRYVNHSRIGEPNHFYIAPFHRIDITVDLSSVFNVEIAHRAIDAIVS